MHLFPSVLVVLTCPRVYSNTAICNMFKNVCSSGVLERRCEATSFSSSYCLKYIRGSNGSVPQASMYFFRLVIKRSFSCVCELGGRSWDMWICEELLGYILHLESTLERGSGEEIGYHLLRQGKLKRPRFFPLKGGAELECLCSS